MNYRFPVVALLPLLLAAYPATTAIAEDGSAEPPFRFYSVLDGLTQSEVYDIEQDHAGYLWFTTARGLNRYDGKDFDQYTIADGLPTNSLTALHVDAENTVWVGDVKGGITLVHGARVVHVIAPGSDQARPILDIESVGERLFAIAEGVGILEITTVDHEFDLVTIAGSEAIRASNMVVAGGQAFVASDTGLYRLHIDGTPELERLAESVRRVAVDATGALWAADVNSRVGVWRSGVLEPVATVKTDKTIVSIVIDQQDTVWVATGSELFSFAADGEADESEGPAVKRYNSLEEVSSLYVDRENSLWLSSKSRLIRFLGDRFSHYRLQTSSDTETVWAIAQDRRGRMWFGTQTKLILQEADESLAIVGPQHGVPKGPVRDIVADRNGNLWLSVQREALIRYDVEAGMGRPVKGTHGLEIFDIALAEDGSVWFSTLKSGVFRYAPAADTLTRFESPNQTSVYTLDIAADGSVWYGADEVGIVKLTPSADGSFEHELIDSGGTLHNFYFDHIRVLDATTAWVATEEGGLYLYKEGSFQGFGEATPLKDQTVYLVESLANGQIVVGGEQGLYQLTPGQTGVTHFNQHNGFIGLETNVHATFFDAENFLWIGTVDGATRMDTSRPLPIDIELTPTVVRMETGLDQLQILDGKYIEPDQLGANVEYAAVSLLHPKGVEYSYRLEGLDSDWSPATTNRSVSYPRMSPGAYEFQVRARYPGDAWSNNHAKLSFTVLPFFWQQPWFVGGVLLLALLGLRTAMVYRTRHFARLNDTLKAQVAERTESIENARQKLEESHALLSQEIEARAELEARFRKAFENAPIGMGLLDAHCTLFDANPALKNMFWPNTDTLPEARFTDVIGDEDRDRFALHYTKLTHAEIDSLDEKLDCLGAGGSELKTLVNLSPVRSDSGEFLYAVLQIQDLTESLKLTDQLEIQATCDELTGLLNRRAFEVRLQQAWEAGFDGKTPSYLMFMDLDQFKVVNDTSGHTAGDQLLRAVTEILVDSVRNHDIVARLGGDEFGIILWECPTDVATRIAESIRASIEAFRFQWDAETYRIGISIGGLPIDPKIGDISEVQQLADAACYAAKEAGRNRVHMVAGDKDSARIHRGQVRWVQRLREAMDNNRFAIYAQPIRALAENSNEPERLEILLRLRDPETRRLIPPGAFLPAAERYGLSVELDKWVVSSLLDTLFIHQSFQADERSYWINLSGASIGDQRFADFLVNAIERSPLPRGTINFEITETAVIRSVAEAGSLMTALRKMGCRFALDDFGSGLSSFGYLKKLPVDYLKIDGMFIRDLLRDKTDQIFVKSIIDIAHTLSIRTIAEFVENDEILRIVKTLGADYAQGFAMGRPYVLAPRFPRTAGSNSDPADIQHLAG